MWKIGNVRNGDLKKDGAVYCGRPNGDLDGSILQNPFRKAVVGSNEEAIRLHREYLWKHLKLGVAKSAIAREIHRLADLPDGILVCWCHPRPCHTNTIARAIEWVRNSRAYPEES